MVPYRLHLRRLPTCNPNMDSDVPKEKTLILLGESTTIGRTPDKCHIVLTSNGPSQASNMISRLHADIIARKTVDGDFVSYSVTDRSLNGTYVNDHRVGKATELREDDVIKFGHLNGAAVKPGQHAPQAFAEFAFIVERWNPSLSYPGCSLDGTRFRQIICTGDMLQMMEGSPVHELGAPTSTSSSTTSKMNASEAQRKLTSPGQQRPAAMSMTAAAAPQPMSATNVNHELIQHYLQSLAQQQHQLLSSRLPPTTVNSQLYNSFAMIPQPNHQQNAAVAAAAAQMNFSSQLNQTVLNFLHVPQGMEQVGMPTMPHAMGGVIHPQVVKTAPIEVQKPKVSSPPMECDSSVPSPPKSRPDQPPVTPRKSSVTSESSNDVDVGQNDDYRPRDIESPPSAEVKRVSSPKKPEKKIRKTNEVARLLDDQTETSWVNQVRKTTAAAVHRRPTDEALVEELAKKEKKKKEKKVDEKKAPATKSAASFNSTSSTKMAEFRQQMKQLSDESEVSTSDSETERKTSSTAKALLKRESPPVVKKASKETKKGTSKRRRNFSESDDSDSERKSRKKKTQKKEEKKKSKKSKGKAKEDSEEEDDDDEVEPVVSRKEMCGLFKECTNPTTENIDWILCDDCDQWFHTICILGEVEGIPAKWNCGFCKKPSKHQPKFDI